MNTLGLTPAKRLTMPAPLEQPLISAFEIDQETETRCLSPTNSERRSARKKISTSPRSTFESCKHVFQQAWGSPRALIWRQEAPGILASIWILSLVTLIIFLALVPSGVLGINEQEPCQPDGEFSLIANSFSWWAYGGFFQITLRMGRFDFTAAKVVDVAWDLVVGRGGQAIMSLVSWQVFSEYLQISITTKPATYTMVWLLRFQKEPSAMSTLQLASHFYKRGLASRTANTFVIATICFILGFPTFASSMTGYTPFQAAYVNVTKGSLIGFSEVLPLAYIIHDGGRIESIDGLTDNYYVPWINGIGGQMLDKSEPGMSYKVCRNETRDWDECQLQRDVSEYIYRYGFGHEIDKSQKQTKFGGETIDGKPLNISAFYLPDNPFYWNLTREDDGLQGIKAGENPYDDSDKLTFIVGDAIYNYTDVRDSGFCQPVRKKGSIQEYQWGFSFLQLFALIMFLFLWSVGLATLWLKAQLTLKLNHRKAAPGGWKSLLEFTAAINRELEKAGVDQSSLNDEQLEDEIQTLLQGGSISSKPLSEEISNFPVAVANHVFQKPVNYLHQAFHLEREAGSKEFLVATALVMVVVVIGWVVVNVV